MLSIYIKNVNYMLNMDCELIGFIIGSKIRFQLLSDLKGNVMTPTELSKKNKLHISAVSRALKELKESNLIEVLNENKSRSYFYSITEKGLKTLKEIKNKISFS
jgi:DNA-binding MarR family transcriptional regulator